MVLSSISPPKKFVRWLQVRGNLYAREGAKYIIVCVIQDITEKKSVEEELHQQAERDKNRRQFSVLILEKTDTGNDIVYHGAKIFNIHFFYCHISTQKAIKRW